MRACRQDGGKSGKVFQETLEDLLEKADLYCETVWAVFTKKENTMMTLFIWLLLLIQMTVADGDLFLDSKGLKVVKNLILFLLKILL